MVGGSGPVLVLGGTGPAREVARHLVDGGVPVVSSLAGRVAQPRLPVGEVRIGGFGGVDGLAAFLIGNQVSAVIDATHPFAARITANAAAACGRTGVPLVVLDRPSWEPGPGDRWVPVASLPEAATAIEDLGARRVLLTTGRQGASAFAGLDRPRFWLRAIEAPDPPLPPRCELILERGPFTLDGERTLLHELDVDLIVSKNSGGPMTTAKLTAARERGIRVIMVRRPPLPAGVPTVPDAGSAVTWLRTRRDRHPTTS
jgi:precorrin-6A/cobalt-precorrin-6A reductase